MLGRKTSLFVQPKLVDGAESYAAFRAGAPNPDVTATRDVTESHSLLQDVTSFQSDCEDPILHPCSDSQSIQSTMVLNDIRPQDECSTDGTDSLLGSRPQHLAIISSETTSQESATRNRPRLTLSAFRRNEESIRVVDHDRSRKITDNYKLCGGIGHGAMSTVRLAERRSDGHLVAIKSVCKYDVVRARRFGRRRRQMDEWEALRMLKDNPNVIDLIDVYETDDEVQMVLEYCSGGELFEYIQRKRRVEGPYYQSESQAAKITEQLLSVLNDLHGRGMVHRDIKPENVLLGNCANGIEVKICDFGIARLLLEEETDSYDTCSSDDEGSPLTPARLRAYSTVGSDLYAAPEVCMGDGYGTAVDIYALGVTIYILLCGFPPVFDFQEDGDACVSFPDPQWSAVSDEAKDLIRRMLDAEPEMRVTAEKALNSPWITRHAGGSPFFGSKGRVAAQRRASHLFSPLPPPKPHTTVDLEMVKARLYSNIESSRKRSLLKTTPSGRKRRRTSPSEDNIDGSSLMSVSMADLYRGVASAAASATKAAQGILYDGVIERIKVVDDSNDELSDCDESIGGYNSLSGRTSVSV